MAPQGLFEGLFPEIFLKYPVLISIVVLKLKNEDDILQGISKLDYLLKISIFQKYKEQEKPSTISIDSESELDSSRILNNTSFCSENLRQPTASPIVVSNSNRSS